jgi:hypothetical protein
VYDGDGHSVAGASIAVAVGVPEVSVASALSGETGAFDVPVILPPAPSGGWAPARLRATEAGYETDTHFAYVDANAKQDFRLYKTIRIQPRDSLGLTVHDDDPLCGLNADWSCRTVRLTPTSSGTLTVAVQSEDDATLGLEIEPLFFPWPSLPPPNEVSIRVSAGVELTVCVLLVSSGTGGSAHNLMLKASFAP